MHTLHHEGIDIDAIPSPLLNLLNKLIAASSKASCSRDEIHNFRPKSISLPTLRSTCRNLVN